MARSKSCIVYMRARESERRANTLANWQQTETEGQLESTGWTIRGRFGDPEFAAPFQGWLEPRPAWDLAVEATDEVAHEEGSCSLIVLCPAGIGTGDPFYPSEPSFREAGSRVLVCAATVDGRPVLEPTCEARKQLEEEWAKQRSALQSRSYEYREPSEKPVLQFVLAQGADRIDAYLCNGPSVPSTIQCQDQRRPLDSAHGWAPSSPWVQLKLCELRAHYLESFFKGETAGEAIHWRVKIGEGRGRWIGNFIFSTASLVAGFHELSWYPYEPQPLLPCDFQWQNLPYLQTERLNLRNWSQSDMEPFLSLCRSEDVMRFLGGPQDVLEAEEDFHYFSYLGATGPTFWVLERSDIKQFIGFCGAIRLDDPDSPVHGEYEIGWRLKADAWGYGFATEAAAETLRFMLAEQGADRVISRISKSNLASRRVAERLGMKQNSSLEHTPEDAAEPLMVYAMTRQDYPGALGQPAFP